MMLDKVEKYLKIIVTFIVVLSPFLCMYGTGVSTITLLDASIIILGPIIGYVFYKKPYLFKLIIKEKSTKILISILMFLLINFFINSFSYSSVKFFDILLRTLRLMYYLLFVLLIKDYYFSLKYALNIFKWVSVFATLYLFLQYILLAIFNYSLTGYIPFLTLMRPELKEFTENLYFSMWARPRSIFAEPSQYAIYISTYLALSLFWKLNDSHSIRYLLSFGLIISSSTTGILLLCFVWIIYFILYYRDKITMKQILKYCDKKTILLICFLFLLLLISSKFDLFISRLASSFINRVEGFSYYFNIVHKTSSCFYALFGGGMDISLISKWASSTSKILIYFGSTGFFLFVVMFVRLFSILSFKKSLLLFFLILVGLFTELWVSSWLILMLPILLTSDVVYKKSMSLNLYKTNIKEKRI